MPSYKENQKDGMQKGPNGKWYVIPGGPKDPNAPNAPNAPKVEEPKFEGGIKFKATGTKGVFTNPMGEFVDASGRKVDAPPEVPTKTIADRAKDELAGQYGNRELAAQDLENKYGLDLNQPSTLEEAMKLYAQNKKDEKKYLEDQQALARQVESTQFNESLRQMEGATAATTAALAQSREGAIGTSAPMAVSQYQESMQRQESMLRAEMQSAELQRQDIMRRLKVAQAEGDQALIDTYTGQLEIIGNKITQIETQAALAAQSGIETAISASDAQIRQDANKRANLDSFTALVNEGVELGTEGILRFSEQLNIDFKTAYDYYQGAQSIRDDKTLTTAEKQVKLEDATIDLQRKMTNRDLEEVRKVDYLTSLYQSGASQEEISAYKQLAGITDENDPVYKLDLQIKQAEAKIKQAEANGEFVSPIDRLEYATKMAELAEKTGGIGVYKPTSSKYDVAATNNGIIISVSDGQKLDNPSTARDEGQCGAFVNDVLGIGVGNTLASKTKFIDESVVVPAAGMAFVSSRGYDLPGGQGNSGHIGIVESVNADGTFNTVEANYNGDGKISRRENVPVTDVIGFIRPEKAEFLGRSGQGSLIKTLDEKTIDNVRSEANSFRQEPIVKDYNTTLNKYQSVQSILDSEIGGPGDLALVFEFMKGLDPTSVVRESEYESAAKSGNIFAGTFARFNGYLKPEGGFLPENVKQDFVAIVKKKLDVTQQQYENLYEQYSKRINNLAGGTQVANELLTDYSQAFNKSKVSTQTDKELLESFYAEEITSEQVGLDSQSLSELDLIFSK